MSTKAEVRLLWVGGLVTFGMLLGLSLFAVLT